MVIDSDIYKNVRPDRHTNDIRWDWLCRKWLEVIETCEMQSIHEFSREFGVNDGQLIAKLRHYKKKYNINK